LRLWLYSNSGCLSFKITFQLAAVCPRWVIPMALILCGQLAKTMPCWRRNCLSTGISMILISSIRVQSPPRYGTWFALVFLRFFVPICDLRKATGITVVAFARWRPEGKRLVVGGWLLPRPPGPQGPPVFPVLSVLGGHGLFGRERGGRGH